MGVPAIPDANGGEKESPSKFCLFGFSGTNNSVVAVNELGFGEVNALTLARQDITHTCQLVGVSGWSLKEVSEVFQEHYKIGYNGEAELEKSIFDGTGFARKNNVSETLEVKRFF